MPKLCRQMCHLNIKRRILWRVIILRRCLSSVWNKILACWMGKAIKYRQLHYLSGSLAAGASSRSQSPFSSGDMATPCSFNPDFNNNHKDSSDLVSLKISLLGDSNIGKTSFLTTYLGKGNAEGPAETGLNQIDKTLCVKGARISYSIWEVAGGDSSVSHVPAACKDSVAIFLMFDLTSRCTLKSVLGWYQQARQSNLTAIPVLIGTKFDEFVQLPLDLQWTIASQARAYAKALNATLFFSSATYNINVNKIFKFVTAQLFNLPWAPERNLTIGEPIVDF